ncbi:unnamed protein product [Effrenium voratum]|nr:unnamed protein product [Effrenium voratum]
MGVRRGGVVKKQKGKGFPFCPRGEFKLLSYKDRQRAWVLAGLRRIKAPLVVLTLVGMVFGIPGLPWKPIQHFETFSGMAAVTRAELQAGRTAIPFDVCNDCVRQDFTSPFGFSNALYWALCLQPGSGKLTAPICSTWVWISRGSTGRSRDRPLGSPERSPAVATANTLVSRLMIILMICSAKGIFWVLEQPQSSLMEWHPDFQKFLKLPGMIVHKVSTSMQWFGAPSRKSTLLYSSHKEIEEINSHARKTPSTSAKQVELAVRYRDSKGVLRVKGGPHLKASQSYPKRSNIRSLHARAMRRRAMKQLRAAMEDKVSSPDCSKKNNREWAANANLDPVFTYLGH